MVRWTEDRKDHGKVRRFINKHPWAIVVLVMVLFAWAVQTDEEVKVGSATPSSENRHQKDSEDRRQKDLKNVRNFRKVGITKEIAPFISTVVAYESILTIYINRKMALAMKRDPLDTKRAVLTWMRVWKTITGKPIVTVDVEWDGIPIATGGVSFFGGEDQVEIH